MNRFKSVVVGVLVAVVVFGGIQVASAKSSPCKRVGATKMQSAKTFKCVKTAGKLVWKVTPTTTTTTTVASTTTTVASTTTVAVVPTVSIAATWLQGGTWPKAVSVTSNVVGTVYLVEGASPVGVVGDITKLSSQYWMSASITQTSTPTVVSVDVEALTNGYYRVYVANAVGVLSTPAVNKVTVSITRACTSNCATTTTVALTCALGGTCVVGDTGQGGGIVFYVGSFTASGTTCNPTCRYLEAAPNTWSGGSADPLKIWATAYAGCYGALGAATSCQAASIYPAASVAASRTAATAIGMGMANTTAIVARHAGVTAGTYAASMADAYSVTRSSVVYADWFLPSKGELNAMHTKRGDIGGFATDFYWSSSEGSADGAWGQYFNVGGFQGNFAKGNTGYVRPVRSF